MWDTINKNQGTWKHHIVKLQILILLEVSNLLWPQSTAQGILAPQPGVEPVPPALDTWSLFCFINYFRLCWVFVAAHVLFLVAANGFYLFWCVGFSVWWVLLLSTALGGLGFSSCSSGAQKWRTSFVAPQHVRSSRTRDQTRVPCIGRRVLHHWTTRDVSRTS